MFSYKYNDSIFLAEVNKPLLSPLGYYDHDVNLTAVVATTIVATLHY